MKSPALRLALFAVFVGILAAAAYALWHSKARDAAEIASSRAFLEGVRATSRSLLELKSAQAGYVAAGQGEHFWFARVDAFTVSTREGLAALLEAPAEAGPRAEIEAAAKAFEDFQQMDRRARNYVRNGQRLLASDLVFSDGIDKIDAALAALARGEEEHLGAAEAAAGESRRGELMALAAAATGALLVVFALVPLPAAPAPVSPPAGRAAASPQAGAADRPRRAGSPTQAPATPSAEPVRAAHPAAERHAGPPPGPAVDLAGIAALCTDLGRVVDLQALPAALARAAALLDAPGIVLWVADPDGRELTPVLAHGYPQQVLARMGTIHRDAGNVTAAAFRTGLLQTVASNGESTGAIATPLIGPDGPIGVMAAEVLRSGERQDAIRAATVIVAAQLATLMGPPAARGNAEAAGA